MNTTLVLLKPKNCFTGCRILLFSASAKRCHSKNQNLSSFHCDIGSANLSPGAKMLFWRNNGLAYIPQSKWKCHLALWLMSSNCHTANEHYSLVPSGRLTSYELQQLECTDYLKSGFIFLLYSNILLHSGNPCNSSQRNDHKRHGLVLIVTKAAFISMRVESSL